jgi:hypothetical protein
VNKHDGSIISPVGEPRGHRETCQKQFLLQLVMTLMRDGTQVIDGQAQTVNDGKNGSRK